MPDDIVTLNFLDTETIVQVRPEMVPLLAGVLQGEQGPQGIPGRPGDPGERGAAGSQILSGGTAPDGALGVMGDWYIQNDGTGALFQKTGSSLWSPRGVFRGPAGATGPKGDTGDSWTVTTVTTQAAYDAATPAANQLVVLV